jgi:hypothetical protein
VPFNAIKDPNAVLDYKFDWSSWLATSETISTSTWTVPAGLTKQSDTHDTTSTTIWLTSGTAATSYTVVNEIVTNQGRTEDRSLLLFLEDR